MEYFMFCILEVATVKILIIVECVNMFNAHYIYSRYVNFQKNLDPYHLIGWEDF